MTKKTQSSDASIYSRDTEQMVLGCVLSSEASFKSCFEKNNIEVTDFHYSEHQAIFLELRNLYNSGSASDVHLIAEQLKRTGKLEVVGGVSYLMDLAGFPGTSAYFESYFHLLKEISTRREFVFRCDELKYLALNGKKDIFSMAALATTSFAQISQRARKKKSLSLANISKGEGSLTFIEDLKEKRRKGLQAGKWQIPGISTGYFSLDGTLGGLRDENFIIVAARPSVGKTAFALNSAEKSRFKKKIPVAFFSLEMTANQLFLRLLSSQAGVSANKIETGQISDTQIEQIETALQQLEDSPIFINRQPP